MASKLTASDINGLLDCPVCLDRFSQMNLPKLLPCSHNVCVPCLHDILDDYIVKCPICRKHTPVADEDISALITNLPTLQLADLQLVDKCQVCRHLNTTSTCFHCERKVCSECLHKHTKETETQMLELHLRLSQSLRDAVEFKQEMYAAMTSVKSSVVTQTERINTQFEMLVKQLQSRRDYLILKVNTHVEGKQLQCEQINTLLKEKVEPLRSILNEIADQISDVRCKLTKQTIDDTYTAGMRIVTDLEHTLPRCTIDFPEVVLHSHIDAIVREIDQWDNVTSQKGVRVQYEPQRTGLAKVEQAPTETVARVDYKQRGRLVRQRSAWWYTWRQQRFALPSGVAVDALSGEVFVADGDPHHQIHVFTPSGQYLRRFGGQGVSPGQFKYPKGVSINHKGEIIVCDSGNHRCQILTATGESIRQFGQADSGKGALKLPTDVTVDDRDNMYVTSVGHHCVKVYNKNGTYRRSFGALASDNIPCYIQWSRGICFVCDNTTVQLWSDSGKFIRSIGETSSPEPLIAPRGVAADQHGNILVLDVADQTVKVYSAEGESVTTFPVAECLAERDYCCYLTCSPDGAVIVSDSKSQSVLFY